jgi:hypothetical protein
MDRVVLLGLLGIPLLVIAHIALVWHGSATRMSMIESTRTASNLEYVQSQGRARPAVQLLPSHFVIITPLAQGS